MKKNIITGLICFLLGICVTVGASVAYNALDVSFKPSNSNWNVTNVEDAINDLYDKVSSNNSFEMRTWLSFENYGDLDASIVLSNEDKINSLINNEEAMNYLLNNVSLQTEIKNNEDYYTSAFKSAILAYDLLSKSNNEKMFEIKFPCYVYNLGTYYYISNMYYKAVTYQTGSVTNTSSGILYTINGSSEASASVDVAYSDTSLYLNGYNNMGIDYEVSVTLPIYNYASFAVFDGTLTDGAYYSRTITSPLAKSNGFGNSSGKTYLDVSAAEDKNYAFGIESYVNKYQLSGNYTTKVLAKSIWLE